MIIFEKYKMLLKTFVVLSISSITLFGYFLIPSNDVYLLFWPAAGFTLGYYMLFKKEVLGSIIIGLFLGHILSRMFIVDEAIWFSFMYGSILVLAEMVFIYIFHMTMVNTDALRHLLGKGVFSIFTGVTVASFIYAIITASFYVIFQNDMTFIQSIFRGFSGHFYGGLLFGTIFIYSDFYDSEDNNSTSNLLYSILYLSIFTIVSILVFKDFGLGITYDTYKYVFLVLFFIPAFMFSFKMMITVTMLYIALSQGLYIEFLPESELFQTLNEFNLSLIIMVFTSSVTRVVLLETRRKNAQLEAANDQLEDMIESTFTLFKLGEKQQFQEEFNSEEYLADLFQIASKIFRNYDHASCYVREEEFVKFVAVEKYNLEALNNFKFRVEDFEWERETPEHVVDSSKMVKQSLTTKYQNFVERTPELKETIKFCLFLDNDQVGGMSFDITTESEKAFTKVDYENIKSFQRIMNTFYKTRFLIAKNDSLKDEIVLSLIRTLELYDQYTGGHSEEVAKLSKEIAIRMGLTPAQQYEVFWAGIVHDIGKVGIPSEILNKPERLSLEEYETIKAHPVFGYEILEKSPDLHKIANLVKHHHEWWNGAGYPDGLKAEEIPLGAQIISCTDAVSSMATKRPYTQIKTSQEILKEIKLYKGSQFSPRIADEVIKFIEEGELDRFYLSQKHI